MANNIYRQIQDLLEEYGDEVRAELMHLHNRQALVGDSDYAAD